MINSIKGTADILPQDSWLWEHVEKTARSIFAAFAYKEIKTPVIEPAPLFVRGVGKNTDIVEKQMYVFKDRGGREICLRPEETASVVRAYIQNNMHKTEPFVKLFYIGSMYRSERPQSGRQREFYQIGAELIGSDLCIADIELIILLNSILRALGIKDFLFKINSLGCEKDKQKLKKILKERLANKIDQFCDDCKKRYNTNILRVLDCKNTTCRKNINSFYTNSEYLCQNCKDNMDTLVKNISKHKVEYKIDPFLVRGLDYYTGTVFEVVSSGLGAQDAIAAGGRYDNLIQELGGPKTGACGFALGMERVLKLVDKESIKQKLNLQVKIFIASLGNESYDYTFNLTQLLRQHGISCEMDYQKKSLKSQLRYANKINAEYVIVIGEDEIKTGNAMLKAMETGQQTKVAIKELADILTKK